MYMDGEGICVLENGTPVEDGPFCYREGVRALHLAEL